jgi:hypothetical protein
MKSLIRLWAAITGGLMITWGLLAWYDTSFSNGDGVLSDINFNLLLSYLIGFTSVLAFLLLATKSRYGWVAHAAASLFGLVVLWLGIELFCWGAMTLGWSEAPLPFHSRLWLNHKWLADDSPFWGDISPEFGRWRLPSQSHKIPICTGDSISISSNSFGMRDKERQLGSNSSKKRAVLLGDSFLEGHLVDAPNRYSNLLESATGSEHLNFGINGTSPINYYLTYKHLASHFAHDVVIVSLLPANDFEDYTEDNALDLLHYPIYRPYWKGDFPHVELAYSLADIGQSIAAPHNYRQPLRVQYSVDSLFQKLSWEKKIMAEIQLNSYAYNFFTSWAGRRGRRQTPVNSFSEESFGSRWQAFAFSLEKLLALAKGKKVILVGMPILSDVEAYDIQRVDDFSPRIQALCRQYGADYINLLPILHAHKKGNWQHFYIPCDGHFSALGEKLVALALLRNPAYRRAMGITP